MTKEYAETLTEVSEILKNMNSEDVNKIPKNLLDFIYSNKSNDYNFKLSQNDLFDSINIKRETLAFLGLLSLNYWCKDEKEKKDLYQELKNNEEKYELQLKEQYNPDNLFKNKSKMNTKELRYSTSLIEYKESLFKKIFNKIRQLLK